MSTLRDSTSFSAGITEFKVSAFTNYGVHHSDILMGYSIDNLAPMIPTSFTASIMDQNIVLMWNQSSAEDFDHYNLEKSLSMIRLFSPKKAILTNLHTDLDYDYLKKKLPPNVLPAYDGLSFNF